MKVIALISSANNQLNQFQYDKILAALTFDLDVTVIFMEASFVSLLDLKIWRSLSLYGVKNVYYYSKGAKLKTEVANEINDIELKLLLNNSDLIL
jgi:hypothetical protein